MFINDIYKLLQLNDYQDYIFVVVYKVVFPQWMQYALNWHYL